MNQLKNATSLYLRQHKNNPVQWRIWGKLALSEAKNQKKPILLSSGYAACHWCHVMAHESFENETIAQLINENFIPIKIDREERPEIDALYMEALQNLGQQGGWPLTMFLDEDANPFWGGTYFPNPARGGMIGFQDVLNGVVRLWQTQKQEVHKNRDALKEAALQKLERKRHGSIQSNLPKRMAEQLLKAFDLQKGGIQGAPKFANLPMLEFLWAEALGGAATDQAVIKTLNALCLGGIYDHIGGGIARYAVDENWHVPHFEKMLYDNAMLIHFLSEVWRETKEPLFAARVEETINFLEKEMLLENGFAASLDADSINEGGSKQEGAFYTWKTPEIESLLKEKAQAFSHVYNITPEGNWREEKTNVLFLTQFTDNWKKEKELLFQNRLKRQAPQRDEKIIASWNGFAIGALAHAAWVFDNQTALKTAQTAFSAVENALIKDARLIHSFCDGSLIAPALLDDLASMADAALTLYLITQEKNYLARAQEWVEQAQTYHQAQEGGFHLCAKDAEDIPLGAVGKDCHANDNVMPAANSLLAQVCLKLFVITGKENYSRITENIMFAFGGDVVKNYAAHASWLHTFQRAQKMMQVVLIGDDGSLDEALKTISLPHIPIIKIREGQALEKNHPSFGKKKVNNLPTAYICLADKCLPPITDKEILINTLIKGR